VVGVRGIFVGVGVGVLVGVKVGIEVGVKVGVGVLVKVGVIQDRHRVLSPPTICGQVQSVVRVIVPPGIGAVQLLTSD
jgi:hypothetical protein